MEFVGRPQEFAAVFLDYFRNPTLLAWCGLAIIPIILHFLLKNKPKKLLFPALRLLQLRSKQNIRKLRLRHIWLLLLRIAAIVLLVLAIARPTLPAANYSPNLRETLTFFAVLAVCAGTYFGLMEYWRRRQIPSYASDYRRTVLRGGTGVAFVLLVLLLVVWPYRNRVLAEIDAPMPNLIENLPVAGVFLFDTRLTMSYTIDNKTRLDAARDIARAHLQTFRQGSRVAIASSSRQGRLNAPRKTGKTAARNENRGNILFFKQVSGNGVKDDLSELKIDPLGTLPLDELLEAAIEKQKEDRKKTRGDSQSDLYVREIYLFTDLTRRGWSQGRLLKIREDLKTFKWLRLYLVDVGVEKPVNVSVTSLSLSKQVLWPGEHLHIDVTMKTVGEQSINGSLKLWIADPQGNDQLRKIQAITLRPGIEKTVQLTAGALPAAFNQGRVQFVPGPDEPSHLVADDSRFLSVASRKKPKVLIVSDYKADTRLWQNALQPEKLAEHEAWFLCTYRPTPRFLQEDLTPYDVVYLINVRTPTVKLWTKLTKFVKAGGGLGVILGSNDNDDKMQIAYDVPEARKLLPGEVLSYKKFSRPQYLLLEKNLSHPIISSFKEFGQGELEGQPVYKCWRVRSYQKNNVIAEYTHRSKIPALLVHSRRSGQVVLMTTAVGRRGNWNDLSLGATYMLLAHRMTQFLTGQGGRKYNFVPGGEPVSLHFGGRTTGRPVLLRKPGAQVRISSSGRSIDLDQDQQIDRIGNYQIVGNDKKKSVLAAFSFNFNPEQTDLTRLTEDDLEKMLGKGRFQRARDIKSLNRAVSGDRYGKEIYELVLLAMICAFCGELLVANRFYTAEQSATHQPN